MKTCMKRTCSRPATLVLAGNHDYQWTYCTSHAKDALRDLLGGWVSYVWPATGYSRGGGLGDRKLSPVAASMLR